MAAGCANLDKKNILEASLVAQFKTPISAESDLLAAARGLLIDKPGIACILGPVRILVYTTENVSLKTYVPPDIS